MSTPDHSGGTSLADLVEGIEVLCLDAGNTVIFLDHGRVSRFLGAAGVSVDAATLVRGEGEAKLAQERGTLLDPDWVGHESSAGARAWGAMVGTMITRAGVPERALPELLPGLWAEHVGLNLWSLVPEDLPDALRRARAAGAHIVVVSNSEGMLEPLFERLGVASLFDRIVDSALVGFAKPDPRIFLDALSTWNAPPARALHLGDSIATDVLGARAAGVRVALVDPFGHCTGRALDVPRVDGAAAVADALARALTLGV